MRFYTTLIPVIIGGSGSSGGGGSKLSTQHADIVLITAIQSFTIISMDIRFELNGFVFIGNREKAERNRQKHDVSFEDAAAVFFDPYFRLIDASRNEQIRHHDS